MDMFTASPNIGEANPAAAIDQSKNNESSSIFASENIQIQPYIINNLTEKQ